jgi:predicted nucleotidyltransferase
MQSPLNSFNSELKSLESDQQILDFCRKRVLHGTPYIFKDKEEEYYEFRKRIAFKYSIRYDEVVITGSAKLGFSPRKKTIFSLDSDIDVAIKSTALFEHFLEETREYQMNLRDSRKPITELELSSYHKYLEYIAIGWIRPDKLPLALRQGQSKRDWFDFFNSISYNKSEVGNYKVSAGVFRSANHLELYIFSGIKKLHQELTLK